MAELAAEDRYWISVRLNPIVHEVLKAFRERLFVAGGFLRDCVTNDTPQDIDLFPSSDETATHVIDFLRKRMAQLKIEFRAKTTDNAVTFYGPGLKTPLQLITRWKFDRPEKCVESFDFTIARAAVWYPLTPVGDHLVLQSFCDPRFYSDLAAKRLRYCSPVRDEEAGGSMLRAFKFARRGYTMPLESMGAVIARLAAGVKPEGVAALGGGEAATAQVLTGLLREVDPLLVEHA